MSLQHQATQPAAANSLYTKALQLEQQRHLQRLQEVGRMQTALGLLQQHLPALEALGARIDPAQVYSLHHLGPHGLHLTTEYWNNADALFSSLLQTGFTEDESKRCNYGAFEAVTLHHPSTLRVSLHVSPKAAAASRSAADCSRRSTDAATAPSAPNEWVLS